MNGAVVLWSGGKDASLALAAERRAGDVAVVGLVTTVVESRDVVTAHEVPLPLIEAQAEAAGLPLSVMHLPDGAPNDVYEARMAEVLAPWQERGVWQVVAGDVYLDDIRAFRERLYARLGVDVRFPLWGRDTNGLARRFMDEGFAAVVASVDTTQLPRSFAGRSYDEAFLTDLPAGVDPCGEDGAFHTFVHDAPYFSGPVGVHVGETQCGERMCRVAVSATGPRAG